MAAPASNLSDPLDFLLAQALAENGNVELAYTKEFALAMARAQVSEDPERMAAASTVQGKLKARFKSEFNIPHFREMIKIYKPQAYSELPKTEYHGPASRGYIINDRGGMVGNVANAITMMSGLSLQYNSFSCLPFLTEKSPWGTCGDWTDYDDVKAAEWCQRQYLNIDKGTASDAALTIAQSRKPHFHPVVNYLSALRWDKQPRLDRWLYRYMGCVDDPYTRAVAAKWMISAVKRAFEPGCQADYTLVLEGSQGKRKSTALRVLAGGVSGTEWFSDDISEVGSKDSAIQLQGKWIVELAELDAFRRAEMTTIKAWLVRRDDNFRPPYGRRAQSFPRQNIFAASTNKDDWGTDDTGLRRFWPVKTGSIDVAALAESRDQLWAEAHARYRAGEPTWLGDDVADLAAEAQASRQDADAWRELIEAWIATPQRRGEDSIRSRVGKIYLTEIPYHCLHIAAKEINHSVKLRISRVLTLAGWVKRRESQHEAENDGVRREYWIQMKGITP